MKLKALWLAIAVPAIFFGIGSAQQSAPEGDRIPTRRKRLVARRHDQRPERDDEVS